MTFHVVHIGDLHLGPGPRNDDRRRALDQIIAREMPLVEGESGPSVWLIPGDLNHARMSIDDRNWLASRIQRMAGTAPVVICYGNHDLPGELDVFARLDTDYRVHVVSTPQVLLVCEIAIFVLPYPTRGGLLAAGASSEDVVADGRAALEAIFMEAGRELEAYREAGRPTLMIGHVNVAGALSSVGQPQIGHEIELDAALLTHLGDCPVLLNHIHKAQDVCGAHYAGSVCRLDWGEIEVKSYSVVEMQCDGRWEWRIDRRPIDVPPMYHVEGDLTRDGFVGQVTAGPGGASQPAPESWAGCEVRVRYRFKASERSVVDDNVIRAAYQAAATLHLDPIAVPDRALRAPEVAAARTLPEKLQAWCAMNGTDAHASLIEKVTRLERGDPALLSDVAVALDHLEHESRSATDADVSVGEVAHAS